MIVNTNAELAEAMGVGAQMVTKWKKRGLQPEPDGTWDVDKVRKWHAETMQRVLPKMGGPERMKGPREPDEPTVGMDEAIRRKRHADAGRAELEYRKALGSLFDANTVEDWLAEVMAELRRALLGLGKHLAPLLIGKQSATEIQAVIDKAVFAMLERMARSDRMVWRRDKSAE